MKSLPLLATACLLALTVDGCGGPTRSFFPLEKGHWWEYSIHRVIRGEPYEQRLILASLGRREVDGQTYYLQRRPNNGVDVFEQTDNDIFQINGAGRQRIFHLPLQVGDHWQKWSSIYFLELTGAFAATFEDRKRQTIELEHVVESMTDSVNVAAGSFANCLRVKATGAMFGGRTLREFLGIRFIRVEQTDWYAPGVGLVRRVRREFTTPAEFNHEYRQELVAHHYK